MTEAKYEINIASVPDRNEVVAELWVESSLFAELRNEGQSTVIEVYSHPAGQPWAFEWDRLWTMLSEAKAKLQVS